MTWFDATSSIFVITVATAIECAVARAVPMLKVANPGVGNHVVPSNPPSTLMPGRNDGTWLYVPIATRIVVIALAWAIWYAFVSVKTGEFAAPVFVSEPLGDMCTMVNGGASKLRVHWHQSQALSCWMNHLQELTRLQSWISRG